MKIKIKKNLLKINPSQFMKRSGYVYITPRIGEPSFVRRLGSGHYPRFHVYIKEDKELILVNVHLDQKKASYEGVKSHSGEYDSDLVEKEIARIKNIILSMNS